MSKFLCEPDIDGKYKEDSPNGKYSLEMTYVKNTDINHYGFLEISISTKDNKYSHIGLTRNYNDLWREWVEKDGRDYLLMSEHLEGQTVVDLQAEKYVSAFDKEDTFIWTSFYLSPDKTKLAVEGCYWACPSGVKIYDFTNPMQLSLKTLWDDPSLFDNYPNVEFGGWKDESNFIVKIKSSNEEKVVTLK